MHEYNGISKTYQDYINAARDMNMRPHIYLFDIGEHTMLANRNFWPVPKDDIENDDTASAGSLCKEGATDILSLYCQNISSAIQFPVSTAYLFGLGVVASLAIRNFTVKQFGEESPVNLYVVTAQPPSTGKSGISSLLTTPIRMKYKDLREANEGKRAAVLRKINNLEKEIEKETQATSIEALTKKLREALEELKDYPLWSYATDDATPEAIEKMAFDQQGIFNIISDEADAINTVLGTTYGSGTGATNHSVFLKGWDGGYYSPKRITRSTAEGFIKGCISVLAQDESISQLLEKGLSGRGISERMLILREKNMLGNRNHGSRKPVDHGLRKRYERFVGRVFCSEPTALEVSHDGMKQIYGIMNGYEPHLADGGKYSQSTIRGVIGKMEKQVVKIASVLHIVKEWDDEGSQSKVISSDTVLEACILFDELKETYIKASDSQGFAGEITHQQCVLSAIKRSAERGKLYMTFQAIKDVIKGHKSMNGVTGHVSKLKNEWLPALAERDIIILTEKGVIINPYLKQ